MESTDAFARSQVMDPKSTAIAYIALYGFGWIPIIGNATTAVAKNIFDKYDQTEKSVKFDIQAMKIINIVRSVLTVALLVAVVACPVLNFLIIPFWVTYCVTDLLGAAWKLYKGDGSVVVQLSKLGINALVIGLAMHVMPFLVIGYEAVRLVDRCVELKKGRGFLDKAEDACQVALSELRGRCRSEKRVEDVASSSSSSSSTSETKRVRAENKGTSGEFDQTVEELVRDNLPDPAQQFELARAIGPGNVGSFIAKAKKQQFEKSYTLKSLVRRLSSATQESRLAWARDSRFQPFFSSLLQAPNEKTLVSLIAQNGPLMSLLRQARH